MAMSLIERFPQRYARLGGIFYLAIILLGLFGEMAVRGSLVVSLDAATTAQKISASAWLWRAGIAGDLLMHVFDIPLIVIFYYLLKPVSKHLALTATFFNIVQTAVLVANKLNLLLPLLLLSDAAYLKALTPEQLQALSYVAIKAHGYGFAIGLIFFGFACLLRGYLIFKSNYFPKILGVLLSIAGVSYLLNSFALLLAPVFAAALFPFILVPAFIGETALCLWLLIKGVKLDKWQQWAPSRQV
jgi:hypothetical protein